MSKNNLIFLSFAFTLIIVIAAAKQSTTPEPSPQTIETASESIEISSVEPLNESYTDPIEPIHEQPYIRYELTDEERAIVERVVTAESLDQHLNGQMAVAQCILNTAEAEGMRPDEVVLQPNQYAPPASPDMVSDSVKQAVSAVFDYGIEVIDEPIRFFYAPKYCSGSWHEANLEYVCTIGGHKFFKIPGA